MAAPGRHLPLRRSHRPTRRRRLGASAETDRPEASPACAALAGLETSPSVALEIAIARIQTALAEARSALAQANPAMWASDRPEASPAGAGVGPAVQVLAPDVVTRECDCPGWMTDPVAHAALITHLPRNQAIDVLRHYHGFSVQEAVEYFENALAQEAAHDALPDRRP
ncbi:MAG: hypothetical protein KC620_26000 [Myxococcales bacterium]|nr:hypothetical protein [Myxococcales bacterium]